MFGDFPPKFPLDSKHFKKDLRMNMYFYHFICS